MNPNPLLDPPTNKHRTELKWKSRIAQAFEPAGGFKITFKPLGGFRGSSMALRGWREREVGKICFVFSCVFCVYICICVYVHVLVRVLRVHVS